MAENTKIEWAHHTFNPWIGCTKVSPACDNCYAEAWDNRFGGERWGPHSPRTKTSPANWAKPRKWNENAARLGMRHRVFCASLADVGDNHPSIPDAWRRDLAMMIRDTPNLIWLLLTKRPQNIRKLYPFWFPGDMPPNVWMGTTAENQQEYERRKPHLLRIPARIRFLSVEPLLEPIDLGDLTGIHWVITGGENAPRYRDPGMDAFRSIRDQCNAQGVAYLHKQHPGPSRRAINAKGRAIDGIVHDDYPRGCQ